MSYEVRSCLVVWSLFLHYSIPEKLYRIAFQEGCSLRDVDASLVDNFFPNDPIGDQL